MNPAAKPVSVSTIVITVPCKDWRGQPTTRETTGYVIHHPDGRKVPAMQRKALYAYAREHNLKLEYSA